MPAAFSAAAAAAVCAIAVEGTATSAPFLSVDGNPSVSRMTKSLPQELGSG